MKILRYYTLFFMIIGFFSCKKTDNQEITKLKGFAFGTGFNIAYFDENQQDYSKQIDSLFHLVNKSLSTYIPTSNISKINQGDATVIVDDYFAEVYQKSLKIYKETNGVFDPTIGVLVNAWGFGPKKTTTKPDSSKINSLLKLVGFDKVQLNNGRITKENDSIYFDFNAIAKGYAVDIAGRFLEEHNITDYLVEIGGEVKTKGMNISKGLPWKIGIENPNFDGTRSIQKIIELKNEAIATSGSYRKFIEDSITGKKYVHILDTKLGRPIQSNVLSVSVIGKLDCADVDGYATAIMAMPLEDAKTFLANHSKLRAFIIYSNEEGNLENYTTSNF